MSKRLELLEKMIANGSQDPFHHYARALELRSLGRVPEALTALESVTHAFPHYVPSYLMAAQLSEELSDHARAKSFAERGVVEAKRAGDDKALSELEALIAKL